MDRQTVRVLLHRDPVPYSSAKNMKATKGMLNRRVPLEACLAPLLLAMKQQADVERVVPELPSECVLATELRRYIRKAGITRRDLLEKSDTFKRLTWHDLRGTHATWCAVRGDSPLTIQQRLGHKSFTTTQGYIVEADARRHGFGEPFPTLPEALSGGGFDHQSITSWPRACAPPERFTNLASPGGFATLVNTPSGRDRDGGEVPLVVRLVLVA